MSKQDQLLSPHLALQPKRVICRTLLRTRSARVIGVHVRDRGLAGTVRRTPLSQRLADMAACDNVAEFIELFSEDISAFGADVYTLRLDDGWTLSFKAAHLKQPTTQANDLDWSRVRRIMILAVEQPNG